MANLTFWMNGVPGVTHFQNEGGGGQYAVMTYGLASIVVLTGVVTGFLGRRSRRRRTAIAGSVLSGMAFVGLAAAGFALPYYTFVTGLAWSPDGTRIAYTHDGGGTWVVSADGSSAPVKLASSDSPVGSSPAWSPDGTRIAYAEDAGIWVVSADGSSPPVKLIGSGSGPAWSPDGTRIAYTGSAPPYGTGIWVVAADGSSAPVKLAAEGDSPAWSPDGTEIAYVATVVSYPHTRGALWLMDADGGNPRQLVLLLSTQEQQVVQSPAWSPDGRQIAYVGPSSTGRWGALWVTNVDGSGGTLLSSGTWGSPQWMPEGRIAFEWEEGLCVVDASGADRQVLLASDEGKPLAIGSARVISPDGTRVVYATGAGVRTDIVVHTIDGSTQITLIH